jgi:hypothetical protein
MDASMRDRLHILVAAADLTTEKWDSTAVAINASSLLAWVEDACCPDDMQVRMRCLQQAMFNRRYAPEEVAEETEDNPEEFLRIVGVLYAFATAASREGGVSCLDTL